MYVLFKTMFGSDSFKIPMGISGRVVYLTWVIRLVLSGKTRTIILHVLCLGGGGEEYGVHGRGRGERGASQPGVTAHQEDQSSCQGERSGHVWVLLSYREGSTQRLLTF